MDPPDSLLDAECRIDHDSPLGELAAHKRIFVNRNLRLRSIGAIGFDLDHTLAHYRRESVDELAFRITQRKLVEKWGYPEVVLRIGYDPDFVVRGLVIDRRRGNILKMDYHNYVVRAYHGRRALTTEERRRIYQMRRIRLSGGEYACIDSPFHTPEAYLYLALVDLLESNGSSPDYLSLHRDVRVAIDEAHADGSIKAEIRRDPAKYLAPEALLSASLRMFREDGKKLFLLTNSEHFYTELVLGYLLGDSEADSWREYFDLVVVDANKPAFFRETNPPEERLLCEGPGAPVISGGNVWQLEDRLGFAGDAILYWGDHTYGDILRSKKSVGWRTAMIIPELERELIVTEAIRENLDRLTAAIASRAQAERRVTAARIRLKSLNGNPAPGSAPPPDPPADADGEPRDLLSRLAVLEADCRERRALVAALDERCSNAYNPHWGMLFREANQISRFGHQVRDFACIYTSRVSNFLHYPRGAYFRAPQNRLPHELSS